MKKIDDLSENIEKLKKENTTLKKKLKEAEEIIHLFKRKSIDALVESDNKVLQVFTEKAADKIYRVLINEMHEGAVILNEDGTILYCNSFFANLIHAPLQRATGAIFSNFIAASSKQHFETLFKQGWKNHINDQIYMVSNGQEIPVRVSVNTFKLDDNDVLSIILTDVTIMNQNQNELKQKAIQLEQKNIELAIQNEEKEKRAAELLIANEELAFQNVEKKKEKKKLNLANIDLKELEELIEHKETIQAILSHDLRSPLTGIIGTAKYLKSNFKEMESDDVKEMLELLYKASKDELKLLDNLVEWERIKFASEVFSPTKIELTEYVKKVFDTLGNVAKINTINLNNEIEDNTNVFADGKMLLSILQNIVSNAIKHSKTGGKITVTAKMAVDKMIIEIKDNGIGMSEEIQKKLFTPQIQSLSETRKKNKGAGIGLLLVKGFLEKNKGEIWVESIEGIGSSFYFTLPINKTPA